MIASPSRGAVRCRSCCYSPHDDGKGAVHEGDQKTVWHKEGYHVDYTKCLYLPDDQDDITEYVKAAEMLDTPREYNVPLG